MANFYNDDDLSSTTTVPSFRFKWDVFLSFRGEDTRHTFTDRLYKELVKNGVRTFRDEEGLQRGEEIAPSLVEAIQDSAAAIAVISRRYADSRWCLEELALIMECRRLMLPVFYEVDPSDVRRQKGPFEGGFQKLETRFGEEKVVRWRNAMQKAGDTSGWVSMLWEEQELIQLLVKNILNKLSKTPLDVAKYPVGLDSRIEELMRILDIKANGVRVLVIHGMGGAGKTTLVKALFNKLVVHFKNRSFIPNVRENSSQDHGFIIKKTIRDLNNNAAMEVTEDIKSIREALHEKPVLIVLDDVDHPSQLDILAGKRHWFYEGSRIIITTRNKEAIPECIVVDRFYEMKELKFPEALQLFSYHAFLREKPITEFTDLSEQVVHLTGGLPLALEVFGSCLFDKRRKKDWKEVLRKLEQIRPGGLQDVLEISFNGLDEQEKSAFLDAACFFVKMKVKRDDAVYILRGCGLSGETLIRSLATKSLIKIVEDDVLWMHDQLRDMGRQIVWRENPDDPGMRSRLWDYSDILNVLKNDKGTRNIQGIVLDVEKNRYEPSTQQICWTNFRTRPSLTSAIRYMKEVYKIHFPHGVENGKDVMLHATLFKSMVNLRLLQINNVGVDGNFKDMPPELKFLQWKGCSLRTLPSNFCMQHLAFLDLSESKLSTISEQSWCNLLTKKKRAEKLLAMNLRDCFHLTDLPDLSVHPALEKLILENCRSLVKIHKSVGDLQKLRYLSLKDCSNLVEFPNDVSGLKHLEILTLSGCSKLKELPDDVRSMKCLQELLVDRTAIDKLPDFIFSLKKLEKLSLKDCKLLKQLPASIGKLSSLKELYLGGSGLEEIPASLGSLAGLEILSLVMCKSLTAIPDAIGDLKSLIELFLDGSAVTELPTSIGSLSHLKHLSVTRCRFLTKLPDSIGGLASMDRFWLDGTSIMEVPDQVGELRMLKKLSMGYCTSLGSLTASIGRMLSITGLILNDVSIRELPESIGMLERLSMLNLNNCKQLQRLPSSIGNLKSLNYFSMEDTSITELPHEIGMLSSLEVLKMGKKPYEQLVRTSGDLETTGVSNTEPSILSVSFCNLSSLKLFNARAWKFSGEISNEFEKLASLEELNLSHNNFCSLPASLRGLSILKKLDLAHCKMIMSLPPLPSSLLELNLANCTALESICDLTNLESLQDLNITNCNKIMDIPGLQCLKSLRRLFMSGCNGCFPAVKQRLAKVALRHLMNLSVPASRIPDWFVQEIPTFTNPRNRKIKGIIIGIVICLDQQTSDDFRDRLPGIVDIQAKITGPNNLSFKTTLTLTGVPNTNADQLYLCRFMDFQKLVLLLKDGDTIEIVTREQPYFKGLTLKKYGIHLIFENDDDIEDEEEEEFVNESQRSVSWKMAKFIGSL